MNLVNPLSPRSREAARGLDKLDSYSNYFLGRDSCKWRSRVGHYQRVIAENVWNGIDVEFVADAQGVKTNYHVHPGADASQIQIEYEGLDTPLRVDGSGDLVLATSLGDVKEQAPWAYQIDGRHQRDVGVQFAVLNSDRYGVITSSLDASKELVIDPLMTYSSFFGGLSDDGAVDPVLLDALAQPILCGHTDSEVSFPIVPGAYQDSSAGLSDFFVTKFDAAAQHLVFSTFIGGSHIDYAGGCALLPGDQICVVGRSDRPGGNPSQTWPLTANAVDSTSRGPAEGLVCVLSAGGDQLLLSSFLGGDSTDWLSGVAIDWAGHLIISGTSWSPDFPVTSGCLFPTLNARNSATLTRLDWESAVIEYSTYLSASALSYGGNIAVNEGETFWITGSSRENGIPITPDALQPSTTSQQGFLTLIDGHANTIVYSSFSPGDSSGWFQLLTPGAHRVLIGGSTDDPEFPSSPGVFDSVGPGGYVMELELPNTILRSTFVDTAYAQDAVVLSNGDYLFCGETQNRFSVTPDAIDTVLLEQGDWRGEGVIWRMPPDLSAMRYATYLGGSSWDAMGSIAPTSQPDVVWIGGNSESNDFPTTENAYLPYWPDWVVDAILTKWDFSGVPISPLRPAVLGAFSLRVYPNPFNSSTTISYTVPHVSPVTLSVYDVTGRLVADRALGVQLAGMHDYHLASGALASGMYFVKVGQRAGDATTKIVVVR